MTGESGGKGGDSRSPTSWMRKELKGKKKKRSREGKITPEIL